MPVLDDNKLPSGVTSRSRRRRKQKAVIADEKENQKEEANQKDQKDRREVKSSSSKPRKQTTKATTKSKGKGSQRSRQPEKKVARPQSSRWIFTSEVSLKDGFKSFRSALDKLSFEETASWKDDSSLLQCLIEASFSLSYHGDKENALPSSFYLIQDQESRKTILSTCRKMVKWAAENKGKDPDSVLHSLFLAVHAMRALSAIPHDRATTEAILRLLYHVITTSSSIPKALSEKKETAKTKAKTKIVNLTNLSETVCLAGYDALCFLLLGFSVPKNEKSKEMVRFDFLKGDNHSFWCSLFPVPTIVKDQEPRDSSAGMNLSQLFTICVQSTLAVARFLINSQSTGKKGFVSLLSASDGSTLYALSAAQTRAVDLLRIVGLSWASFMSRHVEDNGGSTTKEIVSLCQQAHRTLWDLASRVSKQNPKLRPGDASLEASCATLRQYALLVLLGHCGRTSSDSLVININMQSYNGKLLCTKYFDSVCGMASKTAASLTQQHASSEPCLPVVSFHETLGSVLDEIAGLVVKSESYPYVEYCAYRALHIGEVSACEGVSSCQHKSPSRGQAACLFLDTPFPFVHRNYLASSDGSKSKQKDHPYSVALRLFFLCLQLRNYFEHNLSRIRGEADAISESSVCIDVWQAKDTLTCFSGLFFCDDDKHAHDLKLRCLKILNLSSLPSTVYKLSTLSCDDMQKLDVDYTSIAAETLVTCIGPFLQSLVTQNPSQDPQKDSHMWDQVVESYGRSAVLWDTLDAMEEEDCCPGDSFEQSNNAISVLSAILFSIDECAHIDRCRLFEKAAKIFASIGKRRANRTKKELSLAPLLHSLSLFTHLENEEGSSENNLLVRWDFVAAIFQSLGWEDAAAMATGATLNLAIASSGSIECSADDACLDILGCLGRYTYGLIVTANQRIPVSKKARVLISRLIDKAIGRERIAADDISNTGVGLSAQKAIRILIEVVSEPSSASSREGLVASAFVESLGEEFTLEGILRAFFAGNQNNTLSTVGAMIRLLSSFMSCLGKRAQRSCLSDSSSCDNEMEMFEGIVTFMIELITSLSGFLETGEETYNFVLSLRASAFVAAACSLLSESEVFEDSLLGSLGGKKRLIDPGTQKMLPLAERFAKKAREEVTAASNIEGSSQDVLYSAVRSATIVFVENLFRLPGDQPNSHEALMEALDEATVDSLSCAEQSQSRAAAMARCCYSATLSMVRDRLSLQGDQLLAAQVALWQMRIASQGDKIERDWTQATTTNLLMSGGLTEVAFQVEKTNMDVLETEGDAPDGEESGEEIDCWREIVEIEQQVGSFRLQLCGSNMQHTPFIEEELNKRLSSIETIRKSSKSDELLALCSWVQSSVHLALSEVAEVNGDSRRSIGLVRSCYQICQDMKGQRSLVHWTHSRGMVQNHPWSATILQSVFVRSFQKALDCMQRVAILHARVGDYRRCEAYLMRSLKDSDTQGMFRELKPKLSLSEFLSVCRKQTTASCMELSCRRRTLWFKAIATTYDSVIDGFQDVITKAMPPFASADNENSSAFVVADNISDIFVVGNLLNMSQNPIAESAAKDLYEKASQLYENMISQGDFQTLLTNLKLTSPHMPSERLLTPFFYEIRLAKVRSLLENNKDLDVDAEKEATALCLSIAEGDLAPKVCKAWAFYFLGLTEMKTARKSGALTQLWGGFCNLEPSSNQKKRRGVAKCLKQARNHFSAALALLGPASDVLSRKVLRTLALVTGPEKCGTISDLSACILIHTSIGSTARQALCTVAETRGQETDEDAKILAALDVGFAPSKERKQCVEEFLNNLQRCAPPTWRFVACAVCPTGEILVSSIVKGDAEDGLVSHTVCIFATKKPEGVPLLYSNDTYDAMIKPLDALVLKSQQQLGGVTSSSDADKKFNDDSAKRGWWKGRKELDEELQELLENMQKRHFDAPCVQRALYGSEWASECQNESFDSSCSDESTSFLCGNLSSKFEAASRPNAIDNIKSSEPKVTFAGEQETQRGCGSASASRRNNLQTQQLSYDSDISLEDQNCSSDYKPRRSIHPGQNEDEGTPCTFLILDENLHRIPFEGLPSFRNRSICRVPSLTFPLHSLHNLSQSDKEAFTVNPKNTSYILDPDANLGATRDRLLPFIEDLSQKHGWQWTGVTGELPSAEFTKNSLANENGLLLYCGHGGGQSCFSRSQLESSSCQSSVILMGCSSGRLQSINHKGGESLSNYPMYYEPEGIALSYLLAGAPCVVGNLWDVTDHDIDRYCQKLLTTFLDQPPQSTGKPNSMARAVAEARSACKMPYIVGCAPVCYGLPVELLESKPVGCLKLA